MTGYETQSDEWIFTTEYSYSTNWPGIFLKGVMLCSSTRYLFYFEDLFQSTSSNLMITRNPDTGVNKTKINTVTHKLQHLRADSFSRIHRWSGVPHNCVSKPDFTNALIIGAG